MPGSRDPRKIRRRTTVTTHRELDGATVAEAHQRCHHGPIATGRGSTLAAALRELADALDAQVEASNRAA